MASTTLALYKSNWVELKSTVTHVGDAWLRSAFYEDSVNGRIYKLRNPVAVLQFGITGTIAGKTIKSVKLNYYAKATSPHSITTGAGIAVAPFLCDGNALDHLTASRVMTSGLLGEWQVLEQGNMQSTAYTYPQWRVVDITDIFKSNIYNNAYFTIMLRSAPGITTDEYTEIGGVGSEYAAYLSVEYEDDPQKNPTPTYPNSVYVNEYTDILFAWAWNSTTEATQASVQLEYKLKTAGSYTVVNLTQSTQTYKLVGGLAQGVYTWRIKGTNSAGTTSDYSVNAEFTVVGKPAVPIINTPANRSLTEITWNTDDQNAFDIQLIDEDGKILIDETVASSASSYKPNMFLNGTYTVGVRVRNSTGLSSNWAYKVFAITAAGPTKPTMTLYVDGPKVYVDFTPSPSATYYLMRQEEGKPEELAVDPATTSLGKFTDTRYKFYVPYKYYLRAYAGAGYTDSDPVRICHGLDAIILESDDDELILNKSEETFLPYEEDATGEMAAFNTVGREFPISEHGLFDNWQFSSALYVTEEQKEKLRIMKKKNELYYRDYSGRSFPVAIQGVNFTRWQSEGYIAQIQFVRVSGEEVIINV